MQTQPDNRYVRVRELEDLPPLSTTAQLVMDELGRDDIRIPQLARAIEQDPALMGRIIGVANSAYFGCSDRIYTVSDSILKVLGLNMVRSLAYSIVLAGPLRTQACRGFKLDQYWYLAVTTATLARNLARRVPDGSRELAEGAYLCGMLHNFGVLVLAYLFPRELAQVLSEAAPWEEDDFLRRQQEILGITHQQAGLMLGSRWHLPASVLAVMEHYRQPDYRGEHWQVSTLVGLCARLAAQDLLEEPEPAPSRAHLGALGLDPHVVSGAYAEACVQRDDLRKMAQLLAFD